MLDPLYRGPVGHVPGLPDDGKVSIVALETPPGTQVVVLTEADYEALLAIAEDARAFFAALEGGDA